MVASKKRLQMKLNLMDEEDLIEVFCVRFDPDDTLIASCKNFQMKWNTNIYFLLYFSGYAR